MLRLTKVKLPLDHAPEDLRAAILKKLRIASGDLVEYSIFKRSYDVCKRVAVSFVHNLILDIAVDLVKR